MAPMAVCRVKQLAQGQVEVNISEELGEASAAQDVSHALVARSARAGRQDLSRTQELDSVVSAKIFDDIADGFESAANAVADVTTDIGEGVVSVGLTVGDYVGNAATVVGSSIVEAAETTVDALPSEIKSAAQSLGNAVVSTTHFVADVGEMVADGAVDLAGDALQVAQYAVSQGAKVGSKLGDKISSAANALGGEIAKLGDLAVGLAKAAWDEIKKFINCFTQAFSLCNILIGHFCDCERGSSVSISTSGLAMTCSFKTDSDFAKGYGFSAGGESFQMGDDGSSGRVKIPGQTFFQSFKPKGDQLKANQVALNTVKQAAPKGSCETSLALSLEGVVQFAPTLGVSVNLNGDAEVSVEGLARVSLAALATAQGSCAFIAEKRFPKKPLSKVVCGPVGCISIMLQMLAEIELKGVITGSLELAAGADFHIKGKVLVNPRGHADADFETLSIEHQFGMGLAVSSTGSTRVGMGPVLVVFPMPGVPITFNPMMNAEVRAAGTLNMPMGSLLQEDVVLHTNVSKLSSSRVNTFDLCGAAALNIYTDIDIQGYGLPKPMSFSLGTSWIEDAIKERLVQGARMFAAMVTGPTQCIPGASQAVDLVMDAALAAAGTLSSLIPDLNLDFTTPSSQLLAPTKLFCIEAFKTSGFDSSECSQDLGCKSAGRPVSPMVVQVAPEQKHQTTHPSPQASGTCHTVPMGDRFIQLGDWRLGDIDGQHFSVSHKGGYTAQIFRSDGTVHAGPRHDYTSWGRPIGASRGIKFGFQFIQIGEWRLGVYDETHMSLTHQGGQISQIFRADGTLHNGPRTDMHTFDRPECAASGVTLGNQFIQIGLFRLGQVDDTHMSVSHTAGRSHKTIQIYRADGTTHSGPRDDYTLQSRHPVAWTCQSLEEIAHGACNLDFGTFGDRFIQLGEWRLADIDGNHFSISHKDGYTAQIFHAAGTLHPGPRHDFGSWHRPLGYPYGIAFGRGFVQIGRFRLGQVDGTHLSISSQSGQTAQIFNAQGTLHPGPRTDFGLWGRSVGPATRITFGEKFLELGDFRLGDSGWSHEDGHFSVTHKDGMTIQIYRSDGTMHPGPRTDWSLNNRHPMWHCGNIQYNFGSCPGIVAGGNFLQIGEWRMGQVDARHFSLSHQGGQTAQIFHGVDGTLHPGPRTDFNIWSWGLEPVNPIQFGDRFIQFGHFRLGDVDGNHLSISSVYGQTMQIWSGHGTLHPGPRTDFSLWHRPSGEPVGVSFGDRFVQLGSFRVGDVDGEHFTVTHVSGSTAAIYRKDGTVHAGPRHDYTTFGRSLAECHVLPP